MEATALSSSIPEARTAPLRDPFIAGPVYDGFFFFGSVLAVVAAWIASAAFHVDGFYVLAAVAVVSNGPHLGSTWTRVYLDRREWQKRPLQIFLVPALITAAVVSVTFLGWKGQRLLDTLLLYWATWHFLAQNYGLLRIYQKRSGEPDSSLPLRLERPLMYMSVAWCALHRLKTGPRQLFGQEVFYPDLPWPMIDALLAVTVCLAVYYLWVRLRRGQWRETFVWLRVAFVFACFVGFAVPFLLITRDGTTAFAAAACWHGFQYIGIVRFYNRNAWKDGVNPKAKIISWVSQQGRLRLFLYACLLWAFAGAGYLVIWSGSYLTRGPSRTTTSTASSGSCGATNRWPRACSSGPWEAEGFYAARVQGTPGPHNRSVYGNT
jgi:hypothetical protein